MNQPAGSREASNYREAADLVHTEARWCREQELRGETPNAVDALLKVEGILRRWDSP